ncbi:AAA family ATPase, partial [Candidatus Dojkabacteria bacterium]|nr:AAA family ATPase [Candidatus Dojkabacteria bacterium]
PASHLEEFVGREYILEEIHTWLHQKPPHSPIVIFGPWKIGKTSLIEHIAQYDTRHFDVLAAKIDCNSLAQLNLGYLLANVAESISERMIEEKGLLGIHQVRLQPDEYESIRKADEPVKIFLAYIRRVARVLEAGDAPPLVIMIDEFSNLYDNAKIKGKGGDPQLFRNLRNIIESARDLNIAFILVIQAAAMEDMQNEHKYGSELLHIAQSRRLGPLKDEALDVLVKRIAQNHELKYEDKAISKILDLSGCNPYITHLLCNEVVRLLAESGDYMIRHTQIDDAIPGVLQKHADSYFRDLYTKLIKTEVERKTIHYFSRTNSLQTKAMIQRELHSLTDDQLERILKNLVTRGMIKASGQSTKQKAYKLQIPLFATWLDEKEKL